MTLALDRSTPPETLAEKAKRWQKALKNSATGPTAVAGEIVLLAGHWEKYKGDADGAKCTSWLAQNVGHGLAWYQNRADAMARIGISLGRHLHHETAVWLCAQTANSDILHQCAERLHLAARQGRVNGLPINPTRARPLCKDLLGLKAKSRAQFTCPKCGHVV